MMIVALVFLLSVCLMGMELAALLLRKWFLLSLIMCERIGRDVEVCIPLTLLGRSPILRQVGALNVRSDVMITRWSCSRVNALQLNGLTLLRILRQRKLVFVTLLAPVRDPRFTK